MRGSIISTAELIGSSGVSNSQKPGRWQGLAEAAGLE
jgi:hypothetical protein